jgi:hypothetical protein
VLVLLNQLGPPRPRADERSELARWRERVAHARCARGVLPLDAFARCWVQEDALLAAVQPLLPADKAAAFERLRAARHARARARWQAAMAVLARRVARAAMDREPVAEAGWTARLHELSAALGLRREGTRTPREEAMHALAQRLDTDIRATTDELITLHGLAGHARDVVLTRLAEHYALHAPLSEGKAAVLGGVISGALAGLKADLATGGMTLGGGLLAGGVLGALGALGLARGYNLVRGVDRPYLTWSDAVLHELMRSALLGYLAVAHYGRGRGEWAEAEHPAHWADAVDAVLAPRGDARDALWERRDASREGVLQEQFVDAGGALLERLYPDTTAR